MRSLRIRSYASLETCGTRSAIPVPFLAGKLNYICEACY